MAHGAYSHVEGVGLSAIVTLKSAATESTLYEIQEDKPTWLVNNDRVWIQGFGELTIKEVYSSNWIELSKKLGIGNKETIKAIIYSVSQGNRLVRTEGIASHAEGIGTITTNAGESAVGRFNRSVRYNDTPVPEESETLFSVGNGTSDTDRKNVHEITTDGKHYVLNVGNYNGKTLSGATDLATVINSLSSGGGGKFSFREFNQREIPPIRIDIDSISHDEYISFDDYGITEDQEEYMNLIALTRFSDGYDGEVANELFNVIGDFSVYAIVSRTNMMLECIQYDESGDEINSAYVYLDLKNRIVYSS